MEEKTKDEANEMDEEEYIVKTSQKALSKAVVSPG
jgi:hypothetical protein